MEDVILKELAEIKRHAALSGTRVLKLSDVALMTGLSKSNLYKKTCSNAIPFYKNEGGKHLFFEKSEIESWCLKHRHATSEELETEAANYVVAGKTKKGGTK